MHSQSTEKLLNQYCLIFGPPPQETVTFTKLKQTKVTVTIQDRAVLIINAVKYSCLISSIWSHKMIQYYYTDPMHEHGTQASEGHSMEGEIH